MARRKSIYGPNIGGISPGPVLGGSTPNIYSPPPAPVKEDPAAFTYEPPPKYDYMTGEQFFTDPYRTGYEQWTDPYTQGMGWEELGQAYSGIPVVSGHWEGEQFVPERSLYNQASQLRELRQGAGQVPSFGEYALQEGLPFTQDLTQTDAYRGLEEIARQFASPDEELSGAEEAAARAQGFLNPDGTVDVAGYREYISGMRGEMDVGVAGQTGIRGTEYEAAAQRATQGRVETIIDSNMRMVEALGTRSSAAAYSKMGEVSSQINDVMLQSEVKLLEQDMLMKQIEYEALADRYQMAQTQGLAAGQQYIDTIINNRMGALQSYAVQMDTIIKNNEQTFQQYAGELERLTTHADLVYKSIMTEIGYDEHLMQAAEDRYNQYMAPILDEMQMLYQQALIDQGQTQIDIAEEEQRTKWGQIIFGGVIAITAAIIGLWG